MYPIVVFDTNVLLSGLGWRGSPYRCLELARTGQIKAITCQELLDELLEKLEQKLNFKDKIYKNQEVWKIFCTIC